MAANSLSGPGGRLAAARTLAPLQQGELDGLCGLYAVINALRLGLAPVQPLSRAEAESLFYAGIVVIEKRGLTGSATIHGLSQKLWRRITTRLAAEAAELASAAMKVRRPFGRLPPLRRSEVFAMIEAAIDSGHPVLIALSGTHSHYTVISGYSATRFTLFDSSNYRWLERRVCGLCTDLGYWRHRLGVRSFTILELQRKKG